MGNLVNGYVVLASDGSIEQVRWTIQGGYRLAGWMGHRGGVVLGIF